MDNEPRSLKEQRILNKMLATQAKLLAKRHLTRLGLNTSNVPSYQTNNVRPIMAAPMQRRSDYVVVEDWNTRVVAEQYPSIQRGEQQERDNKVAAVGRVAVIRRMYAARPETIARVNAELAENISRLSLIQAIERAPEWRRYGKLLRRQWFPGSF